MFSFHLSGFHNKNLVGFNYSVQSMRNGKDCTASLRELFKNRVLNQAVSPEVHGTGGLIEEENLTFPNQGPNISNMLLANEKRYVKAEQIIF